MGCVMYNHVFNTVAANVKSMLITKPDDGSIVIYQSLRYKKILLDARNSQVSIDDKVIGTFSNFQMPVFNSGAGYE